MKARVKATGEIIEISTFQDNNKFPTTYDENELEFLIPNDYWTRLEHQAAIAAMQGMIGEGRHVVLLDGSTTHQKVVERAISVAHALVEKMKETK